MGSWDLRCLLEELDLEAFLADLNSRSCLRGILDLVGFHVSSWDPS